MNLTAEVERRLLNGGQFRRHIASSEVDLVSLDGSLAIELVLHGRGTRDIRDGILRLAEFVDKSPRITHAYLVLSVDRTSPERIADVWNRATKVLQPDITVRMRLILLLGRQAAIFPSTAESEPLAQDITRWFSNRVQSRTHSHRRAEGGDSTWREDAPLDSRPVTSWRELELEKVLLHQWLLAGPPLSIQGLCEHVGCSKPVVLSVLKRLRQKRVLRRFNTGHYELADYPGSSWSDLLVATRIVYQPIDFVDVTSQQGTLERLVRRFQKLQTPGVAIGGTEAARHWDPAFDLNGTPRVDLIVHTPLSRRSAPSEGARSVTELVRTLDPALIRKSAREQRSAVLVMHQLYRNHPLFHQNGVRIAGPVEAVLNLHEMGLTSQAEALVRHLRGSHTRGES